MKLKSSFKDKPTVQNFIIVKIDVRSLCKEWEYYSQKSSEFCYFSR